MIVSIKDSAKLIGISIISCCAVFVCTLFLNFNLDIISIRNQITSKPAKMLYEAQVSTGKVVSYVSGGCLLLTSVIMLFFYIKHYIDSRRKELGILKALGYSNLKIAKGFYVFGLSIFIGTSVGFSSSFALMPAFYNKQNENKILPEYSIHFHPSLALYLVILPTVLFCLLAIIYAYKKLKRPEIELLKGKSQIISRVKRHKSKTDKNLTFLQELKKNTVKSKKSIVFFIAFASFCYSAMMQMSFSMKELSGIMFSVMMVLIGIILAFTTLFLAITTVINSNTKAIAMMRVFGYSQKDCSKTILSGYKPAAYIGFTIGTVYQYVLLRIMVSIVFKNIETVPEYSFDFRALFISLLSFAAVYELIMHCYCKKINKISLKEIMME